VVLLTIFSLIFVAVASMHWIETRASNTPDNPFYYFHNVLYFIIVVCSACISDDGTRSSMAIASLWMLFGTGSCNSWVRRYYTGHNRGPNGHYGVHHGSWHFDSFTNAQIGQPGQQPFAYVGWLVRCFCPNNNNNNNAMSHKVSATDSIPRTLPR
jgi:hypothetical protein